MKQGNTLAVTIALLPIVFPQMPICFSAYITYDWDFHKAWHANGQTLLVQWHITFREFRVKKIPIVTQRVEQQMGVWAPEKNSKYTKTENSVTTDRKLLPKEQNTTDYRITIHAVNERNVMSTFWY